MPGHVVRPYAQPPQQQMGRRTGQPEGRLGHPGVGDRGPLGGPLLRREGRRREHGRDHRLRGPVQQPPQSGERREQLAEHADPLTALAREQERHQARIRRLLPYVHPLARGEPPGPLQPGRELVEIAGHDRHPDRTGVGAHLRSQVAQCPRPPGGVVLLKARREPGHRPPRRPPVLAAEAEQFGRPVLPALLRFLGACVTGQYRVVVGAAEAERAHPGDPPLRGHRPRPGLGVEDERAGVGPPGRVRSLDVQGGRPDPGVHRPGRLDQPGQARRALGVPELRFHRAQRASAHPGPGRREHLVQHAEFGAVADHRARTVRLDQADLARRDARPRIGPLQGPPLPFRPRRGQPEGAAVAGRPHRLDHRVDAVAVPLRVRQPLQDQRAHPSPSAIPSAAASKGRQRPPGDRARTEANSR